MGQSAAQRILQGMQHNFQDQVTYRVAAEADFPHLRIKDYHDIQAELEALRFRHLVDHENMRVSASPGSVIMPTLIRRYVSVGGNISSDHYQVRPNLRRRLRMLLTGLLNLRWIAAPRNFLGALKTRNCVDFETELSDGSFITTSNALAAAKISLPAEIDGEHYPYGHPVTALLQRHRQRLAARLAASPGLKPLRVDSVEDVLAMSARLQALKARHRQAVGWVTNQELRGMAGNQPVLADHVHQEVQKLLQDRQG